MDTNQFVQSIASLLTFEETYGKGLDEEGVTDPRERAERLKAAQTDIEYLIGCEETLEALIREAREVLAANKIAA